MIQATPTVALNCNGVAFACLTKDTVNCGCPLCQTAYVFKEENLLFLARYNSFIAACQTCKEFFKIVTIGGVL